MLSSFEQFTSKNAKILWGVLAVILIALPFVVKNQYFLTVVAKIGCYAILGLGLNILTGYTGLVSLGHAGFVAIGAYTASLLAVTLGWSFFPAMLAGMLLAASRSSTTSSAGSAVACPTTMMLSASRRVSGAFKSEGES